MQPHGRLGDSLERYLQSEAEMHFQELSAIKYELSAGRTKYSPKRVDMYTKLLQRDMSWLMNDMIWSNESETVSE
ncbi:MAG TPA: hypothetical protein VI033_02540 [Candidatus Nitrosopolaris sp.]